MKGTQYSTPPQGTSTNECKSGHVKRVLKLSRDRRGLTLIELLMSLVILGSLAGVVIPWLQLTADLQHTVQPQQAWTVEANIVVRLIRDDLTAVDALSFLVRGSSRPEDVPSRQLVEVLATPSTLLRVQTRTRTHLSARNDNTGPTIHEYGFDAHRNLIVLQTKHVDPDGNIQPANRDSETILLTNVAAFECDYVPSLDLEESPTRRENNSAGGLLLITVISDHQHPLELHEVIIIPD